MNNALKQLKKLTGEQRLVFASIISVTLLAVVFFSLFLWIFLTKAPKTQIKTNTVYQIKKIKDPTIQQKLTAKTKQYNDLKKTIDRTEQKVKDLINTYKNQLVDAVDHIIKLKIAKKQLQKDINDKIQLLKGGADNAKFNNVAATNLMRQLRSKIQRLQLELDELDDMNNNE